MPGARGRTRHGVAVVDGLAARIVHRQRGQALHHRRRGHRHHVDAPADRRGAPGDQFLGREVPVGQHHDLRGVGVDERAEQALRADRPVGVGPQHVRTLAGEQRLRAVAVDDRQHRAVVAPAAGRPCARVSGQRGDLDPARCADVERRLHRAARVVGVDVHRVLATVPRRRDGHRLAEPFEPLAQQFDARVVALAEQVHHLELRRRPVDTVTASCDGGAGWYSARCGACPASVVVIASSRTSSPRPPASTTPASGEHVELLWGLLQGDAAASEADADHRDEVGAVGRGVLGRTGGGLQHRDDGAGHRLADRGDDQSDRVTQCGAEHGAVDVGEARRPVRRPPRPSTSARPRRICDRMTPELPRAPCNAPSASAAATATTSSVGRESARAHADRIVNSMFVPVSASATGKTLSRLISSVWAMRPPTAVWAQSRRVVASSRRADMPPPSPKPPRPLEPSHCA